MAKLKRLSTEVISSLWLEPMSFNQIERELQENRDTIESIIDILVANKLVTQEGSLYQLTDQGKNFFSY